MGLRPEPLAELSQRPWCSLDTETTGLGPYDQVLEIAVVGAEGDVWFDSKVAVDRPIPAKATAVHGLSARDLEGAPEWPVVWPRVVAAVEGALVVAWNAAFDLRLMRQTSARHGVAFQAPPMFCLREAFKRQHPHVRSSLAAACLTLGVPLRPKHRALADAELARRLAWCLFDELGIL